MHDVARPPWGDDVRVPTPSSGEPGPELPSSEFAGSERPEAGHELLDAGDGRRLDRFGSRVVDRPAPAALWPPRGSPADWAAADLAFERVGGWTGADLSPWTVGLEELTLELRPTEAGQVGLFPEHLGFWPWLRTALAGRPDPQVLNLFASTGATTLALVRAGARVTHVDSSRPTVAWARHNAALSGLADRPIRWIVDDALTFTAREARRGRRYDGIVLDPPTFGHGPRGSRWELSDALAELLDACAAVATEDAFVLLTAHATGLDPDDLGDALVDAFEPGSTADVIAEPIDAVARSGASLSLGGAARMIRG
jgi:23S rRNA (cytosine1962-C5)-methyltransferase